MAKNLLIISLVLLVVLAGFYSTRTDPAHSSKNMAGLNLKSLTLTSLEEPLEEPLEALPWTAHDGSAFAFSSLKGQWSILYFGYAFCPDVCPLDLSVLTQVEKQLQEQGKPIRLLFATLDPHRDTPEYLSEFLPHFSPGLTGLIAGKGTLDKLSPLFRFKYSYSYYDADGKALLAPTFDDVPESAYEAYFVNHTSRAYVIDPGLVFRAYSKTEKNADELAADMAALMEAYGEIRR